MLHNFHKFASSKNSEGEWSLLLVFYAMTFHFFYQQPSSTLDVFMECFVEKNSRISKNLGSSCAKKTNKKLKVHLTGHGGLVVYAAESCHFLHGIQASNSCQGQSFLARSLERAKRFS